MKLINVNLNQKPCNQPSNLAYYQLDSWLVCLTIDSWDARKHNLLGLLLWGDFLIITLLVLLKNLSKCMFRDLEHFNLVEHWKKYEVGSVLYILSYYYHSHLTL